MFIKCLVENTHNIKDELESKHGLCFYIETKHHKLLFDLGPNDLFYKNALKAGIDISQVDTVIISHGHYDHGGGLATFLKYNSKATIYIQKSAYEAHYSKASFLIVPIGINANFMNHPQVKLCHGHTVIDSELELFTAEGNILPSPMNKTLLGPDKTPDDFNHEHSLLIKENKTVLFTGCSHKGIFNILNSVKKMYPNIDVVIGGFHLYNPATKKTADNAYLKDFKKELDQYPEIFYTCHCTGEVAYNYLKSEQVKYISCGEELEA